MHLPNPDLLPVAYTVNRRQHQSVSVLQASQDSPTLLRLTELTRDSVARLDAVLPLIPGTLRSSVTAGPIDAGTWCLLVDGNAVAAKLRQLLPALEAHLRTQGWVVDSIRLKVRSSGAGTARKPIP